MSTPFVGGNSTAATVAFGGKIVTIPTAGVAYVIEGEYKFSRPTRKIRRNDENGDQSDFEIRHEPNTLSLKLQLATSTTTMPSNGVTWLAPTDGITTSITMVVTHCSPAYPQGEFWYCDTEHELAGNPPNY